MTSRFPRSEIYGITSQIRRAATSVAANIAEGHGRESSGVFVQFLRVAQGSLKELETPLMLAVRVEIAREQDVTPLLERCDELGRMMRSLIRTIQRKQTDD